MQRSVANCTTKFDEIGTKQLEWRTIQSYVLGKMHVGQLELAGYYRDNNEISDL
jgi:hypothetical protein